MTRRALFVACCLPVLSLLLTINVLCSLGSFGGSEFSFHEAMPTLTCARRSFVFRMRGTILAWRMGSMFVCVCLLVGSFAGVAYGSSLCVFLQAASNKSQRSMVSKHSFPRGSRATWSGQLGRRP